MCPHGWLSPEVALDCLDDDEVVLRCQRDNSVAVRFAERHAARDRVDGRLFFLVQALGPRFDVRLEGVTNHVVGRACRGSSIGSTSTVGRVNSAGPTPVEYYESDEYFG